MSSKKRKLEIIMAVLLVGIAYIFAKNSAFLSTGAKASEKKTVVFIDAGHGGIDPGKVGVNSLLEKDINLSIAKQLKKLLEKKDIQVIMSREEDTGLYDENSNNKKVEDMRKRCEMIKESEADFVVSIHQNSYHEEPVKGAQVFYYEHSKEGKELAEILQEKLRENIDKDNKREAKANSSYYLLKKTDCPTVIVECGFLSNWKEAESLGTKEYQKKMAKAICEGILDYINK